MSLGAKDPLSFRRAGVRVAQDASRAAPSTPQKFLGAMKAECSFVFYNDERGVPRTALFFKVGNDYYTAEDSPQWCAKLYPMTDWLKKAMVAHEQSQQPAEEAVSAEDAVDVVGP